MSAVSNRPTCQALTNEPGPHQGLKGAQPGKINGFKSLDSDKHKTWHRVKDNDMLPVAKWLEGERDGDQNKRIWNLMMLLLNQGAIDICYILLKKSTKSWCRHSCLS